MSGTFDLRASTATAVDGSPEGIERPRIALKMSQSALGRLKSGARWFYWVAGLSLANTVAALSGGHLPLAAGLGVIRVVEAVARKAGAVAAPPALAINAMAAGAFLIIGLWSNRCNQLVFGIGVVLYAADGVLLLPSRDWSSVAFHALALFFLCRGFAAGQQLRVLADLGQARPSAPIG